MGSINKLLSEDGGVWVTGDHDSDLRNDTIMNNVFGNDLDRLQEILKNYHQMKSSILLNLSKEI